MLSISMASGLVRCVARRGHATQWRIQGEIPCKVPHADPPHSIAMWLYFIMYSYCKPVVLMYQLPRLRECSKSIFSL